MPLPPNIESAARKNEVTDIDKTLYVSDLDGTLLLSSEKLSQYTCDTVNALVERGMHFSFATARSITSAAKVTPGLNAKIPVIAHNGVFIVDVTTRENMLFNRFSDEEAVDIAARLSENNILPTVYACIDGEQKFSYYPERISSGMRNFVASRRGDPRDNPIVQCCSLLDGDVFYFCCIDSKEKLRPAYESLKDDYNCIYAKDFYTNEPWLEIMPLQATKANAVLQLKTMLGCDKIVCFGDGKNDISMFEIADECYAVRNAVPELKAIATAVIGSNDDDGVAKWLSENAKES